MFFSSTFSSTKRKLIFFNFIFMTLYQINMHFCVVLLKVHVSTCMLSLKLLKVLSDSFENIRYVTQMNCSQIHSSCSICYLLLDLLDTTHNFCHPVDGIAPLGPSLSVMFPYSPEEILVTII